MARMVSKVDRRGVKVEDVEIHSEATSGSDSMDAVAPDAAGLRMVVGIAVVASLGLLRWLGAPMFADEGATLYSAHLSWSDLWAQSRHVDLVLLPYYVVIHFWLVISEDIAWVRALSLLAFFGTIVVVGWTGLRIAGRWCGIIAGALTATSTLLVEKSMNARPYELSTFLVTLCAVFLFKWLRDSRVRWLWVFSILALLATVMQLFSLLAPIAMLFCVLVVRPELIAQRLRVLIGPIALLAVASGAWVVACIGQVGQVNWIANESTDSRLLAEFRGPVIGQLYDFVLFVLVVLVVTKLAIVWSSGMRERVVERVSRDRDILALTIGWAVLPTLLLSIVSFAHPIYSVRYVAASAPGAALLVAFACVRGFPMALGPSRGSDQRANSKRRNRMTATIFGAVLVVLLAIGYLGSATNLQEDLQSPAQYISQHAESRDVVALPDHAITSAVDYYIGDDQRPIRLWPQLGVRQRYVEGFDLSPHPRSLPRRVWLVTDDSVPGVTRFERVLEREGYLVTDFKRFDGAEVVLYDSTLPATAVLVPSSGATLTGQNVHLVASGSVDAVRLTKIQFVISGGPYSKLVIGTTTFSKIGAYLSWNTKSIPNGTYSLQSVATTSSGKVRYSRAITVKVDN